MISVLQKAGLCFRCLASGHIAKGCTQRCPTCRKGHHVVLHEAFMSKSSKDSENSAKIDGLSAKKDKAMCGVVETHSILKASADNKVPIASGIHNVRMQCKKIRVYGKKGLKHLNVCFDSACTRTCITRKAVNKVGCEWAHRESVTIGGFGDTMVGGEGELRNVYIYNVCAMAWNY